MEHRDRNTDIGTQILEHKDLNTDFGTQKPEHRDWNTEIGPQSSGQNTKYLHSKFEQAGAELC